MPILRVRRLLALVAGTVRQAALALLAEDGQGLLTEDGVEITTED